MFQCCVACNEQLSNATLLMKKVDGSQEDMCTTCRRIVNQSVAELSNLYADDDKDFKWGQDLDDLLR